MWRRRWPGRVKWTRPRPSPVPSPALYAAQALARVAEALTETGDIDRSRQVIQQAEAIARSITDPSWQTQALADVAEVIARIRENLYGTEYAINGIGSAEGDIAVIRIARTDDELRLEQLLASALAQTTDYLSLVPLLAKAQPAAVIKVAQNISRVERGAPPHH